MAFNLVEVEYNVYHYDTLVKSGKCPTFFVNTLANLYLTFDNPNPEVYMEIILHDKIFKIYSPIFK